MVISAILTTALAPITGALFGASYGTSIRIGYEIIFPALFGDVINEQKNNPTKLQEEGTKRTIQSMHKMFTGVGGAAAMEFGIEQGIEMAKKKIESPDVQNMIDSSLGLTNRQLNKRGKSAQFQDQLKDVDKFTDVKEFHEKNLGDFQGQTNSEIVTFFKQFKRREPFDNAFKLLIKEKGKTTFTHMIWTKYRPPASSVKDAIDDAVPAGSTVHAIGTMYNELRRALLALINPKFKGGQDKAIRIKQLKSQFYKMAQAYNRLVIRNGKRNLAIDSAKSIKAKKLIPK